MALVELARSTSAEAAHHAARGAPLLIPSGSLEQHGPHLPLGTDTFIATALGRLVAERLPEPLLVAPTVAPALSWHHLGFPGTVDLSREAFEAVHDAYLAAALALGVQHVFLISAHGGNFAFLGEYAKARNERGQGARLHAFADFEFYLDAMRAGARAVGLEAVETDVHAGLLETSQGLHLFPDLVGPHEGATGCVTAEEGWLEHLFVDGVKAVSTNGVLGDPRGATAEAGKAIMESLASSIATWIGDTVRASGRES